MKVTHLGHSCLLLDYDDVLILVDPGTFSTGFENLRDLDAVLITHQHPDHVDPDRLPALLQANSSARLLVEPETRKVLAEDPRTAPLTRAQTLPPGDEVQLGPVTVRSDGGRHAVIHADLPRIGNVGLILQSEGEPTVFHPGDSLDTSPAGIDVLAVPVAAPWCAVKETVDFVRRVGADRAVPIHDAVVSPAGRPLYLQHIDNLGGSQLVDLAGRGAVAL